jgi:hypothetical protein
MRGAERVTTKARAGPFPLRHGRPSAICSWTPQHSAHSASKVTHGGTKKNGSTGRAGTDGPTCSARCAG